MYKRILWLAMCLLSVHGFATSHYRLSGVVVDAVDGQSLPGAHVRLAGTHHGSFTDIRGTFVFERLSAGEHLIEVSYLGYETLQYEVQLTQVQELRLELKPMATMAAGVVVSANRADARTAATYTQVGRDEIESRNLGQDIPFLIGMTPSVIVSSDAGTGVGYTSLNIRGSDQSRINITFNGIPVNDSESHGVWWVNMPDMAGSLDNMQIQRGVGLSTHGSGAFGATISLQTSDIRHDTWAELSSSAGSFQTMRHSVGFGTGLIDNQWAFDGRLSRISSEGYIDRASADLLSFYISGAYHSRRTLARLLAFSGRQSTYQAWNGVPGDSLATNRRFNPSGMYFDEMGAIQFYDNETDNYQQDHYQFHLTHEFAPRLLANVSLHYTYGRGYYEQYRANERFSRYNLPDVVVGEQVISRSDLIRQRWLDNHFYGLVYSLMYNSSGRTSVTLGGGAHFYDGDHFGEIIWARYAQHANIRHRYYDNNGFKRDMNSYLKITHGFLPGLDGFADLQYRYVSYDFEGLAWVHDQLQPLEQNAVFHFFNPKAGLSWQLSPGQRVYVYGGLANREPVRRDFTESSPESRPRHERMLNLELGYSYQNPVLMLGGNLYVMRYTDQLVLTGEMNDTGGFTRTNIDRSYRAGIELESVLRITSWLQWAANLSLSRNKIDHFVEFSDRYDQDYNWLFIPDVREYRNTDIAFSPSVIGASMLRFRLGRQAELSLNSKHVGRQYIDNTMSTERMLNAYTTHDIRLNYRLSVAQALRINQLELVVQLNNVFNAMYETSAWIYKAAVGDRGLVTLEDGYFPQAGRHAFIGLNIRI